MSTKNPHRDPKWHDLETALQNPKFVHALTGKCARFTRDPEQVSGITLLMLCIFAITGRYDPRRGSVMAFSLGIARRVAANLRRHQTKQQTGLPYEPCTDKGSILEHLTVREHLDLLLMEICTYAPADQELLWRGAHCRYCKDYPPMTGTERARLHRLRKKLAKLIDYPYD